MHQFITHHNISISYTDEGNGCAVVLLHGFGEDHEIFNKQLSALANRFRVVIPDLPGSGASPFAPEVCNNLEALAGIIDELVNHLRLEKFVLLGHSMGGYLTLAYAEKYGQKLKAFGLLHSNAFADSEEKKAMRRKGMEFIANNGSHSFLKTSIPGLFSDAFQKEHADVVQALVEKGKGFSPESLIAYYEAMVARPERTNILRDAKCPVFFMIGEHDKAAPMQEVLKLVYLPGASDVHILRNSAHMGMLEETDLFNAHLLHFLENVC